MDSNQEQLLWQRYLSRTYRNILLPGFSELYKTIYNTNINKIQGAPHSPKFHETISRSVSPTNSKITASSDKAGTQRKWQRCRRSQTAVLINSWKENFKLTESANSQNAWDKIKISVDSAGPTKSIRQCKYNIRNLKDTYKQAKDNNKRSGSAHQPSAYFDGFNQVLGTRNGNSLKNIAK